MRRLQRDELFNTPPGFDDPLEMVLGCHRRIERQLQTLKRLASHLESHGVDPEASTAAQSVLRYFVKSAASHHDDEELDIFPLLEQRIDDAGESHRFASFRERLEADHRWLQSSWDRLRKPLEAIADGLRKPLPQADVQAFVEAYAHHIITEEKALGEFFNRWLDDSDREALGRAMAARRGVTAPRPPLHG